MKIFSTTILVLLISTILEANCNNHFLLGNKTQTFSNIEQNNSIIWNYTDKKYSVTSPINNLNVSSKKCLSNGYILINNSTINYRVPLHKTNSYILKKGWNYLHSPQDGIDIIKSFEDNKIAFVYTYDKVSNAWAGYSPNPTLQSKIDSTRILTLKYIEPYRGFYIYALKSGLVNIQNSKMSQTCKKKVNAGYDFIVSSAHDKKSIRNKNINIKTRYSAHYRRGVYNDTRTVLIYKNIKNPKEKMSQYGPAQPPVMLRYNKEYENKIFYIYDYFTKACYEGVFPSKKTPPFSALKKLK